MFLYFDTGLTLCPILDIGFLSLCGQLEFKCGNLERGRTILEGIVNNYPKRSDIWNIYLDLEENETNNIQNIRNLYERVASLSLSSKNMKNFFKRFLSFEKDNGNEERVNYVKEKAKQYVESKINQE